MFEFLSKTVFKQKLPEMNKAIIPLQNFCIFIERVHFIGELKNIYQ